METLRFAAGRVGRRSRATLRLPTVCLAMLLMMSLAQQGVPTVGGAVNVNSIGVGRNPSIHGSLVVFSTPEVAVGTDLNGDGDKFDLVVQYYDLVSESLVNTGVVGDSPSVFGGIIVFTTREGWVSTDLNGDGDMFDMIIRYYDTTSATLFNTMTVGESPRIHDDMIIFQGTDLKIRIYSISSGFVEDTGAYGSNPSVFGSTIAFSTSEALVNQDLNGDGSVDPFTSVVRYYDILSRRTVNTGQLGERTSTYGSVIAFDYALNAPIRLYNTTSESTIDTTVPGFSPAVYGDRVFLENGTISVYEISTGAVDDTGIDGTSPTAYKNIVAFETDENIVNRDLNGDHVVKDVVVRYASFLPLHDGAVTALNPSGSFAAEPSMSIDVTVANLGAVRDAIDITVLWNSSVIGSARGIVLDPQATTILTFNWNTTGLVEGVYMLRAAVSIVPGEAETLNNLMSTVLEKPCRLQGDVNGDRTVNIVDLASTGRAFGSTIGSPGYDPDADINKDGLINIVDLAFVGGNFGESC